MKIGSIVVITPAPIYPQIEHFIKWLPVMDEKTSYMKNFLKSLFYFILFVIGVSITSISLVALFPLTDLGRHNTEILMGKSNLLNFFILICGFITGFKSIQKV